MRWPRAEPVRLGRDREHRHRRDLEEVDGEQSEQPDGPDASGPRPRRRARRRHRHDRCRPQHGRQGARGPRLLRRRQPAARRCCATWSAWSTRAGAPSQPIAVVVDVRSGAFFDSLAGQPRRSGATGRHTTLLFLEADRRRARTPPGGRPPAAPAAGRAAGCSTGIQREREVLADLRGDADLVIDTSDLNVHQLTDRIAESFGTPDTIRLKVTVISFGFKYGIPVDADFVADMRFLPNPYWIPELRPQDRRSTRRSPTTCSARPAPREFVDALRPAARGRRRGLPPRGQALHDGRDRLHRRQAPQRRDDRGDRPAAARRRVST